MNVAAMSHIALADTIAATAAIVAFWNCDWPSPWECMSVERLAAIVTTMSLAIAPGLYFARRLHSDMTEGQRAAASLYMELRDTLQGLDTNKHQDLRVVRIQDQPVYFMSRLFNHDVYDSLGNLGKTTFIDPRIHQDTQDVFQRVKGHNIALKKIREMQESNIEPSHAHHLYHKLEESEHALLDSIPEVMRKLKEKYPISDIVKTD